MCLFSTRDAVYNDEDGSLRVFLRGRPINLYAPSAEIATYDITKVAKAPTTKLKLDWAYPFKRFNQRNIIMFSAAIYISIRL